MSESVFKKLAKATRNRRVMEDPSEIDELAALAKYSVRAVRMRRHKYVETKEDRCQENYMT